MKILRTYQQQAVKECWDALKENDEPVLLMASVGSGKSLMLATILLTIQRAGKRALCLVNNALLVKNNCEAFTEQGGNASIYCAALDSKDTSSLIVFGTPQSVINGIKNNEYISTIKFNLIVVDEAHAINYTDHKTCFMRILRHYKQEYSHMRLIGATGTNFRFKGEPIVGDKCIFKKQVANITMKSLIDDGYLIKPGFEVDRNLLIDFSSVKVKQNGKFDQKQLNEVIYKSTRLTELICKQIIHIMDSQNRFGCFIFATTKKHAYEIMSHLPSHESALILGETEHDERNRILEGAKEGRIRYLVNIAIISVGVDVPPYDTVAYLRPTESLVLLVQTIGRVLRISGGTNKQEALVLDFAGNIERHRDFDDPVLLDAVKQTIDKDNPLVIDCPACNQGNTEHARRCVGQINDKRCDYFFEFKDCPNKECGVKNDITARNCRQCGCEIIDPNAKLSLDRLKSETKKVDVIEAKFGIAGTQRGFSVSCAYKCQDESGKVGTIFESYSPISDKAMRVFYGRFVKPHCKDASKWYIHLHNKSKVEKLLASADVPLSLLVAREDGKFKIKKKYFVE